MWAYRCYDDGEATNLWQRWYDATPPAQGSHTRVFEVLEQLDQWKAPYAKVLDKNNDIIEIRLSGSNRIEYRVLGFYGTTRREFIVVATCSKKQNVYSPKGILKTAIKRKKEILADPRKASSCVRPQ